MALDARDRQGIRIFHREDLKTFLRTRYADDPPNHTSQTFQAAQAARMRVIELARMVSRDRLHWFRNNMPRSVLEDHDIAERLQRHAAEADKMEVDQITAGRESKMRFRALTRDDQFLFLRVSSRSCGEWYLLGHYDYLLEIVSHSLREKLAKQMKVDIEDVDASKPVSGYGVDSLTAVDIRGWSLKDAQADISVLNIVNNASIGSLAHTIVKKSLLASSRLEEDPAT
ncbi:uncharacterized protein N7506_008829 [Penicillium brevicompactum]|uniref:uncharacterized protein n=1 Tax=Penicillium brevicompactum TaxID=5074 RepID=UPI002541E893|nr:uncharacterized protein N7506_008829 [Penicillium brevicompactum]KAJ5325727.1 hypothetical protein N7506_008829 [Penicillium brevicompactum]